MSKKRKRVEKLYRKPRPADMQFDTIRQILEDCGFIRDEETDGSHFVFFREDNEEEQKIVPTKKGRKVGQLYFERVQRNVERYRPDLIGGIR